MAGGQERILRRRIKSVESTKKITRAMELISATRVVKAQERAAAARPYSEQITSVILDLVRPARPKDHPLLRDNPDANMAAFVVVTSDRGLCGGYNTTVIRMAERELQAARRRGPRLLAHHRRRQGRELLPLPQLPHRRHLPRRHRPADLRGGPTRSPAGPRARSRTASSSRSTSPTRRYIIGRLAGGRRPAVPARSRSSDRRGRSRRPGPTADLEYEPSPTRILDELLPRYVESRHLLRPARRRRRPSTPPASGP